jgi:drug/metabolite transporter (DMT)-like permease
VFVLRPGVDAVSLGAVLALVNAVTVSVTTIIVKQLTRTERPETIVIYMALLMSPLSLVPALFVWQWPDALTLLWLALLAGAGTAGHLLFTRAFAIAEVSQIQPLEFVRLPLVAALAYLLFGEVPTPWTWLGGSVIFAATAYITHREAQLARRAAAAALHPPPPGA